MKLFICLLVTALLVSDSFSEPLLKVLGRRKLRCKGGILGVRLVGDGSDSQQIQSRKAPAAEPAPAPAPTVNVNVQNIYTKQDNNQVIHNNNIGAVNNNVVNNDVRVKQDINNRAESNVYNTKKVNNQINNNYGAYPEAPCDEGCQ